MSFGQRFKRLGWLDAAVIVAGIAVLIYLQVTSEPSDAEHDIEVAIFSTETRITQLSDIPDDPSVKEAYAEWSEEPEYFGAFAASETGRYGWSERYGAPDTARIGAMAFCERSGETCTIVAESLPVDFEPTDGETLEVDALRGWQEYLSKPGAKAFAHSPLGIAHWAWGHATLQEAERVALSKCETRVKEYGDGRPVPHWPCRLIRSQR